MLEGYVRFNIYMFEIPIPSVNILMTCWNSNPKTSHGEPLKPPYRRSLIIRYCENYVPFTQKFAVARARIEEDNWLTIIRLVCACLKDNFSEMLFEFAVSSLCHAFLSLCFLCINKSTLGAPFLSKS